MGMSKKEQYGLDFTKSTTNGVTRYGCIMKNGIVDQYNDLQFLNYFDIVDTQDMIIEINSHLIGSQIGLNVQFFEHIELEFVGDQLRIDEQPYTFPLTDIRDLLIEWLAFLQT